MDSARMLVYELLAGHVNHVVPQMQLDWRRGLALQLWCVSSSFLLHPSNLRSTAMCVALLGNLTSCLG